MRKPLLLSLTAALGVGISTAPYSHAETYLTVPQAQQALWQQQTLRQVPVTLSKKQMKAIAKASKTRVRQAQLNVWKTPDNGWFIVDQVVGKHEMIDIAVALQADGSVKGVEILQYRETYGDQVRHPKWLAQFIGKTHAQHLTLDKDIKNISGATLSCRHVTDGVNRLTQTWHQILRYL